MKAVIPVACYKGEGEREKGTYEIVPRLSIPESLNVSKTEFNLAENRRWKFVPNII